MTRQHISEGLKRFIREQIQTIFRLETLLLLHRNKPRSFTAVEVANELGFENDVAQEQLAALAAVGILAQSDIDECNYYYDSADEVLGSMVDQLAMGYSQQRVPILSLILAKRPDRIRLFAEAIKVIREND